MSTTHSSQEAARRAVRILGGPVAAARLLNVREHRHQTVQAWLRTRVPAEYCPLFERETRAMGSVVRCEELRPDIQWGVLRNDETASQEVAAGEGAEGAPAVPPGASHG